MICVGKGAAVDDIKRHIVAAGSNGWAVVQARHPSVSPASFWRYVREAKGELAAEEMGVICEQGARSPPSPDQVGGSGALAELGAHAVRRIDYLAAHRQLFADVEALREYALNVDGSIRSPPIFDRSIKRRMTLIARSVKLSQQIYAVRHVQVFIDALIDEVASETPAVRQRVVARLRQLRAAADSGRRS
jgi:hypothetical protein